MQKGLRLFHKMGIPQLFNKKSGVPPIGQTPATVALLRAVPALPEALERRKYLLVLSQFAALGQAWNLSVDYRSNDTTHLAPDFKTLARGHTITFSRGAVHGDGGS